MSQQKKLCRSLFKVCSFNKNSLRHRYFPGKCCKISKTPIFKENYRATASESLAVLIKLFKRFQSAVVTFFCRFMSFFELVLDLVMGFVLWKSWVQQIETLNARISKMVKHTFKNLQHLLQDYWSVSHHFETLCINSLMREAPII